MTAQLTESVPLTEMSTFTDAITTTSVGLVLTETLRTPLPKDRSSLLSAMRALGAQIFERKHLLKIISLQSPLLNSQQLPAEVDRNRIAAVVVDGIDSKLTDPTSNANNVKLALVDIPGGEIFLRKNLLKILNSTS
jgi:hypothetical protein